jgi:hypothetical protein
MMRSLILLAAAALLGGCATYAVVKPGPTAGPEKTYTVDLPANWIRLTSASDRVVVTRDGFGLQRIVITRTPEKDAFPKIKKAADAKLLPSELAALQIAELKAAGEQAAALTVVENAPAEVDGELGFRIRVEVKNEEGLVFENIYCGVLHKGYYYLIGFHAPRLYYYPKYRPDFDRTLASFKFV